MCVSLPCIRCLQYMYGVFVALLGLCRHGDHKRLFTLCQPSRAVTYRFVRCPPVVTLTYIYLFIIYLFICSSTHISTIRQVLKQDSKAQTCTNSYPKITENPTQYKSKVNKSKSKITNHKLQITN